MSALVKEAVETTLRGKTLGEVINDLDKGDLKVAYRAIDTAYDIQWGKDGINDHEERLKGLQGKVGEQVYAVAKTAMEHCEGRLNIARSYFLALCAQAETHCQNKYIQKYKEEKPIGQLIPLWSQYKSSIAKGMERGISPLEEMEDSDAPKYATAAQYRAAVQALGKEDRATGSQAGNGRNSEGQTTTTVQLVTKGWSPKLAAAMDVMCKALNGLTHEEQDKFASKILDIAAEVTTFANERRAKIMGPRSADIITDEHGRVTGTTSSAEEQELDPGTKAALQAAIDKDKEPETAKDSSKGKRKGARAA